jgi:predicted ATPase/class 3 adenylate cyclase
MHSRVIEGFQLQELVYRSQRSAVYRGRCLRDDRVVVIKRLEASSTAADCASLKYSHELLHGLAIDGVPRVLDLAAYEGRPVLIMEDIRGRSVNQIVRGKPLPSREVLRLAISLARTIGHLHQREVIHQDIRPSNIVLNEATGETQLIDFQLASRLVTETSTVEQLRMYRGSLAFVAPERTGRIGHPVDHRSDLYSLGATLFYLLTRRPPFEEVDPVAMIHSHIATAAPAPRDINASIPEMLSRIVLKLLAKPPDERYQSAHGLEADLRSCLECLDDASDSKAAIRLGLHDISSRFLIPEQLYGRQREIESLIKAVEQTTRRRTGLVLVSGPPGIGKSELVATLRTHVAGQRGTFLTAKFDQLQNVPLTALMQCLHEFVQEVLAEPDDALRTWQQEISSALGPIGGVLVEHVPALEKLIGPQPALPEVGPTEALNRLLLALASLLKAICTRRGRLVVFLDDLQWASLNSMRMLESILTNAEIRGLLVIGAYRDTEVDQAHPLRLLPLHLSEADVLVTELVVQPLSREAVGELVAHTLVASPGDIMPLSSLVFARTGGDPFFVKRFLRAAYSYGGIAFNADTGRWGFDLDRIAGMGPTDNVAQLIVAKLGELPPPTRQMINLAACLGGRFSLRALARVSGISSASVARSLWAALSEDVVIPIGGQWRIAEYLLDDDEDQDAIAYRFSHDAVRLAAYELLPASHRQQRHVQIGRLMIAEMGEHDTRLLEGVNQLNAGSEVIDDPAERLRLCELNLKAAMRARNIGAFSDGFAYARAGLGLLPEQSWATHIDLTVQLYLTGAELAYLGSEFVEMDRLCAAIGHVNQPIVRAELARIQVVAALSRGEPSTAVDKALEGLASLGMRMPRKPGKLYLLREFIRTRLALRGRTDADLLAPEVATDTGILAPLRILGEVCRASYTAQPELYLAFILRMVQLAVRDGTTPTSSLAFAHYALLLIIVFRDMRGAKRFGDLALRVADHPVCVRHKPETRFVVFDFLQHWYEPLRTVIEPAYGVFQEAREVGDLETAAVAPVVGVNAMSMIGVPLPQIAERAARYVDAVRNQQTYFYMLELARQRVLNLMGRAAGDPFVLKGETAFDESVLLPRLEAERVGTTLCGYHMIKSRLAFLLQRYDLAYYHADLAIPLLPALAGSYQEVLFQYYDALACLQRIPARGTQRYRALRRIKRRLSRLRRAASHAPMNFAHLADIVVAELAAVTGRELKATNEYDHAIARSKDNGFLEDEAVANELAGRFHLRHKRVEIGRAYLRAAYGLFLRLGATAKLDVLGAEFPWVGAAPEARATSWSHPTQWDAQSLLKASQAIAREMGLQDVVKAVMNTVVESAGADSAVLFLQEEGGLAVAARFAGPGEPLQTGPQRQASEASGFAASIVRYVERTGKTVVIGDASATLRFADDPHFATTTVRSVLCLPIVHQNRNVAVLYLENRVATEAFSPERVELLNALSGQMAISIDNARLYDRLQQSLTLQTELTAAQSRFIPKQFLRAIGRDNIAKVGLGDHKEKVLSILFSDVRGFTTLTEQLVPEESIEFINTYLGRMEPPILQHGGFIDSYIGDAIMALFDADADQAVAAALEMLGALNRLNEERRERGLGAVRTGIGIHTGPVMLGTIGGRNHLKCGVIGDAVNLASRVENLTKQYALPLLITDSTRDLLSEGLRRRTRIVSRVRVAGRHAPVSIFDVLGQSQSWETGALQQLALLEQATGGYYDAKTPSDVTSSLALFQTYASLVPADPLPALYVVRCQRLMNEGIEGAWDLTEVSLK